MSQHNLIRCDYCKLFYSDSVMHPPHTCPSSELRKEYDAQAAEIDRLRAELAMQQMQRITEDDYKDL